MKAIVVSPKGVLYEGPAQKVGAVSVEGAFEVLEGHAPFVAQLPPGNLTLSTDSQPKAFSHEGGFLWVDGEGLVRALLRT
ncbi:MAG: F0F1 ATP synthase subunit epsilon [Bacteroidetes bacterium]|nr:MAG: F0F1 ATP synthase subunit epsilon [Bacteroidota bacterium]